MEIRQTECQPHDMPPVSQKKSVHHILQKELEYSIGSEQSLRTQHNFRKWVIPPSLRRRCLFIIFLMCTLNKTQPLSLPLTLQCTVHPLHLDPTLTVSTWTSHLVSTMPFFQKSASKTTLLPNHQLSFYINIKLSLAKDSCQDTLQGSGQATTWLPSHQVPSLGQFSYGWGNVM